MRRPSDAAAVPAFAELLRPLPAASPRAWRFAAAGAAERAGALLSEGLRIGYAHGFDSGPFMAHVYANRPAGRTALGRVLDRRLLDRRTCVAFRDIHALAEVAVLDAIDAVEATCGDGGDEPGTGGDAVPGRPRVVVADLAAGSAPYLLRAIAARPGVRAVLGDIDEQSLQEAGSAAEALGVSGRVSLLRADAFDPATLAALDPHPDVVVELGLYGIYHDDARIERHFLDLAELVAPRQIVFNVQTRNPEIERIARVWRNAAGERCVWRLRPAEQILRYAAAAGYRPASVAADRHGIYRVVRLEREAA